MIQKKYTSKLLLFGEHIIITGASALALPFKNYYGLWSDQLKKGLVSEKKTDLTSLVSIKKIYTYLKELNYKEELISRIDFKKFEQDITAKVWFESNIPTGYGLGSSGAVCAAIYDRYCINPEQDLMKLKGALAQLENCFHGQSSGIDPLVCYLDKMLLIKTDKSIHPICVPVAKKNTGAAIFLIDTGVSRQTTPFVNYFLSQAKLPLFQAKCIEPLSKSTDLAISAFRQQDISTLLEEVEIISQLQYSYLQKMILKEFQGIWKSGLATKLYSLKLCGAGGGGFILGFTKDWIKTQEVLSKEQLKLIYEL